MSNINIINKIPKLIPWQVNGDKIEYDRWAIDQYIPCANIPDNEIKLIDNFYLKLDEYAKELMPNLEPILGQMITNNTMRMIDYICYEFDRYQKLNNKQTFYEMALELFQSASWTYVEVNGM